MTMGAFVGCSLLTMDRSIESLGCHSWRFGAEWMKHSRRDDYINVKLAALSRSSGTRRACEGAHPPRAVATMFRRVEIRYRRERVQGIKRTFGTSTFLRHVLVRVILQYLHSGLQGFLDARLFLRDFLIVPFPEP